MTKDTIRSYVPDVQNISFIKRFILIIIVEGLIVLLKLRNTVKAEYSLMI